MKKKFQQGFTLIELMIVVAIIGILAAVAIPSYQDYTARAQVTEAIGLASGFKTGMAEHYTDQGSWPLNLTAVGDTTSGKYVQGMGIQTVTGSTLVITAKMKSAGVAPQIRDGIYALATVDGGRKWECGHGGTTVSAQTTILAKFLPGTCK